MSMGPGKYRAKATRARMGESGQKGTPEAVVEFEIVDGQFKGETIVWRGYFPADGDPDNKKRNIESLLYCGWDGEDWDNFTGITDNEVQIVCENEKYTPTEGPKKGEEQTRLRVRWVNEVSRVKPMSPGKLEDFKQRMRGLVADVKSKRGSAPTTNGSGSRPVNREEGEVPEDEISFASCSFALGREAWTR